MEDLRQPVFCELCRGRARAAWERGGRTAYRCAWCGFVFVFPPPPEPLVDDFSHGKSILGAVEHFTSEYHRFLSRVESLTRRGKLLDIGCSIGLSLVVARERGWTPLGIELSPEASRYGREHLGVEIVSTRLEELRFPEGEFDAVVMYHALEHIAHPVRMLAHVARILKPGGVLYASVPNWGGISACVLREKWEWVSKDHVSYFDRRTLARALREGGLQPIAITSFLGARVARRKSWLESRVLDRVSDLLCLSISLESWSRKALAGGGAPPKD